MGSSPAKRATLPFKSPIRHIGFSPCGRLAQLVRASVLHTEGHRFESCIAHHRIAGLCLHTLFGRH